MPWKGKSITELREEFIRKALRAEKPFRHLCQELVVVLTKKQVR